VLITVLSLSLMSILTR